MKIIVAAAMVVMGTCVFADSDKIEECKEEIICDIPYEATYSKCQIKDEKDPVISENKKKILELDPYKAKGKFFVDRKRRQLLVWLGRVF